MTDTAQPLPRRVRRRNVSFETASPEVAAMRAALHQRFPLCFAPKGAAKPPLKIGIREEILALCPEFDIAMVRAAIADYVAGPTYRRCHVAGAERLDLHGCPAGTVTAAEVNGVAKRRRRAAQRRAEQAKQPPAPASIREAA